jgi:hypothetical protein
VLEFYKTNPNKPRLGGKEAIIHPFFKFQGGDGAKAKGKENISIQPTNGKKDDTANEKPIERDTLVEKKVHEKNSMGDRAVDKKPVDIKPVTKDAAKDDDTRNAKKPRKSKAGSEDSDFVMKDDAGDEDDLASLKSAGLEEDDEESLKEDDLESMEDDDIGSSPLHLYVQS